MSGCMKPIRSMATFIPMPTESRKNCKQINFLMSFLQFTSNAAEFDIITTYQWPANKYFCHVIVSLTDVGYKLKNILYNTSVLSEHYYPL